jgi:hypothetical protein
MTKKQIISMGFLGFLSMSLITGCATKSNKIPPMPVSETTTSEYKALSCDKLRDSYKQLESKQQLNAMRQDELAKSDAVLISWGWILYGVPYIFLDGDGPIRKQYEIDLGKMQAMENAMKNNGCIAN